MDAELDELRQIDGELERLECLEARDRLAVYCGLHIPAEIEGDDDLRGMERMPLPARYVPARHHQLIVEKLEEVERGEIGRLMILAPPGSAKALALDTPIPTPDGWTTMGSLKVGDRVFDERGQVCRVTWKSPVWRGRPVFSVRTDCGDEIVADRDHEWLVRLCGKPRAPNKGGFASRPWRPFKIKETWELHRRRVKRPMIARAAALELPDAELPIDPYLLGVWLGDGHSTSVRITASENDIGALRAEIERLGYKTSTTMIPTLFGVLGVRAAFVKLGLLNDPLHNTFGRKHIPVAYMRGSAKQRLALLQGLIDTDGTVCKKRGCSTFCNTNKELAEQVRELVRSLGVKAGWTEGRAMLYEKDCGPVYRVGFYLDGAARMERKRVLCRDQFRTPNTYIDVAPAGTADTVCIEVDSPSHLFLCGRSMTPTHNSTYASTLFPAWYLGRHPAKSLICASQTQELADRFGRRARNMVASDIHRRVFGAGLAPDQRAAGHWETEAGGEYHATGVQPFAGRRGDGWICDDLIRGRRDADSKTVRDSTWEWLLGDLRPRMKPGAWGVFITTRWHPDDPAGRILPKTWAGESGWVTAQDGEKWYVLCLVAVVETDEDRRNDPLGRKVGDILWPEWFTPEMLAQERRSQGLRNWTALYQQRPRPDEGSVLKREHWRRWPYAKPPRCEYVVDVWDTAFEEGEEDDFSACTSWGVFVYDEPAPTEFQDPKRPRWRKPTTGPRHCVMLLDWWEDKKEFPELRRIAIERYKTSRADRVLVEKKSSGHSLIHELRRAGVPVLALSADRSKLARAHAASVVLEDGCVWYMDRRWADQVIEKCAAATFIKGDPGNDTPDTCVHAWTWLRKTFHLTTRADKPEAPDEDDPVPRRDMPSNVLGIANARKSA
ncbi:MAG: hypothetical protein IT514_15455 [Burkholderiales bacterium]|nr:hypothetical protein [Burkholderiales bacterium]